MPYLDSAQIDVIAPNLKRRYSGVTSTVLRLVPVQAQEVAIAGVGPILPEDMPQLRLRDVITMSRLGPSGPRVWHARRNTEMLVGILLRALLRKKMKLLFTSAAQRKHSRYTKTLIGQMDALIATSERSAAWLDRPAEVIHHGIDVDLFSPPADRAALRRELGLEPDALIVGCFGRIRHQKGTDTFVDAMIRTLPAHPDAQAIIMGGVTRDQEAFRDDLLARIENAGLSDRIRILPEDRGFSIAPWFQALDLYVAPPRWEGFGLTPAEAMACEVPVVTTRAGAFEEIVAPEETGLLVDAGDSEAMAAAIDRLLGDDALRVRWAKAGRARVLEHFSIKREAAQINAIYRQLLG